MKIALIVAAARNGVIGGGNKMLWRVPEDFAHFKRTTLGHVVVMGRKTYESMGRPLPRRTNIVITRQSAWHEEGAHRAASLQDALQLCKDAEKVWIIGGAQIYAQALALALADEVVATEIDADFEGDAYAPTLDDSWHAVTREDLTTANHVRLSFVTYRK